MLFWHVPAPNEAMLISGTKRQAQETQFRIVTGHGSFVLPVKQKARMLSLALREAEIAEDCVTQQGIRLRVRAVCVFKVGDDAVSIANAARRFLSEQDRMEELVGRIFAGHLRSIVGGLTVEQIIRERSRVAQEVMVGSHSEMEKLGIVVDALQIQEIEDATGYIDNLAAPHVSAVASQARIAQARADQEASEREQQAAALKAEYERDTAIKRAGFLAETEQYNARAAQAGPLAQARASHDVIEEQTALAERQAQLAAQRLEAEVRRPADAEAYRLRTLAEAARDQARFAADGSAYAERTLAQAQADANSARALSLRDGNQELIAANRVVENLPALADAAARGMAGARLTVLNGTDGVNSLAAGLVGQGLAILDSLRNTKDPAVDGKRSLRVPEDT
ncbi:SPFH domain-containing protein [Streptomyces sp. NBC_00654]|uniref:SPFH domain-containing protein n=1 Tax=Streptomyces sp. NBC_00654 TaxID=2975799 RepID=UPI00224E5ABE|nr:flotillin family protein [Streptomyces sp. NBC_00654]MCX4965744.1 SPFH domain-containing protein [Streptomyces sp. NBC_00654]